MPTTLSRPPAFKRAQVRVVRRHVPGRVLPGRFEREDLDVQVAEFEDVSQLEDVARQGNGNGENVTLLVFDFLDLAGEDAAQSALSLQRWMGQSGSSSLSGLAYQQLYVLALLSQDGWRDIVSSLDPLLRLGHADFVRLQDETSVASWEEVMARLDLLLERGGLEQGQREMAERQTPADEFATRTMAPFPSVSRVLPELHDPQSGRLDAKRIAAFLGMTSAALAKQVGVSSQALNKTPDAPSLQPKLAPFHFVALALLDMVGTPEAARAWLNVPSDEFDGDTPLHLLRNGEVEVVAGLLRDALVGQPG